MEDKILKINLRSFLSLRLPTMILMLIGVGIMYYADFDYVLVNSFLIVWSLDQLPSSYLHILYYLKNRNEEYEIRDDALIKRHNGETTIYQNSEIEKIIIHLSPALYENSNFHTTSIQGYHYGVIKLKTGEELIITCLMAPRIDKSLKQIKGVFFEKKKCLFCSFRLKP